MAGPDTSVCPMTGVATGRRVSRSKLLATSNATARRRYRTAAISAATKVSLCLINSSLCALGQ